MRPAMNGQELRKRQNFNIFHAPSPLLTSRVIPIDTHLLSLFSVLANFELTFYSLPSDKKLEKISGSQIHVKFE